MKPADLEAISQRYCQHYMRNSQMFRDVSALLAYVSALEEAGKAVREALAEASVSHYVLSMGGKCAKNCPGCALRAAVERLHGLG